MITATIKTMNGDLLEIHHNSALGFERFIDTVYEELPTIPYGCLVLRRVISDDHIRTLFHRVLEELEYGFQAMSKPNQYYPDYKERVTRVMDEDYFYALADPSILRPVVYQDNKIQMVCDDYSCLTLQPYYIEFYSTVEYDHVNDEYKYLYAGPCVYFDKKHHLFALEETFEEAETYSGVPVYCTTGRTKWFLSVIECLESLPRARFPQNEETLISIRKQIDQYQFRG